MAGQTRVLSKNQKRLAWFFGVVAFYSLIGFLLLPWFAQRQLTTLVQERLGVALAIDSVSFNPFTFEARLSALSSSLENGEALLSLDDAYVNLDPSHLLRWRVHLADIQLVSTHVSIERHTAQSNTISVLAERWLASANNEPAQETAVDDSSSWLPAIEVAQFQLQNGGVQFDDRVPASGFSTAIEDINIAVADLSTAANETGSFSLAMILEQNGRVNSTGELSLLPVAAGGNIALTDLSLEIPFRYLQESIPLSISGLFDAELSFDTAQNEGIFAATVDGLQAAISELEVQRRDGTQLLEMERLGIGPGEIQIPGNRLHVELATINGLQFWLTRLQDGSLDVVQLIDSIATATESGQQTSTALASESSQADDAWQIRLDAFQFQAGALHFADDSLQSPARFSLGLQASADSLSNQPQATIPFALQLRPDFGGDLGVEGEMTVLPELALAATVALQSLPLQPGQSYLNEFAEIAIERGTVSLAAEVSADAQTTLELQSALSLDDLLLSDRLREETLLSFTSLNIDRVDFSVDDSSLAISQLTLEQPFARVIINEDGSSNIGRTIIPVAAQGEPDQSGDESAQANENLQPTDTAFDFSLGIVSVENGSADFTDLALPFPFAARIEQLEGSVSGFATASSQASRVELSGGVNEFGQVLIEGDLFPLDTTRATNISMGFSNLNMPDMSPYVIKFAGREIADGRMDLDLRYEILDRQLQAENKLVMRDLQLGERIDYPDAMSLPLDLAVGLLKDGNGVIDLEVPVTGDVGSPEFSYGRVISRALGNVITNIVAAPFRLLGNLVGAGEEEIDLLQFPPGSAELAPPEREKLTNIAEAMAQRPQLALQIPAVYEQTADRAALQTLGVESRLESTIQQLLDQAEETRQFSELRVAVLQQMYGERVTTPTAAEVRSEFISIDEVTLEQTVDELAYGDALLRRLIESEPIPQSRLDQLAANRSASVLDYLTQAGLNVARMQSTEVAETTLNEQQQVQLRLHLEAL